MPLMHTSHMARPETWEPEGRVWLDYLYFPDNTKKLPLRTTDPMQYFTPNTVVLVLSEAVENYCTTTVHLTQKNNWIMEQDYQTHLIFILMNEKQAGNWLCRNGHPEVAAQYKLPMLEIKEGKEV